MATEKTTAILDIRVNLGESIKAVEEYRKSIEKAKAQQKELRKELKEGTITNEEYEESFSALEKDILKAKDAMQINQRAVKNLIVANNENTDSLRSLRAQLSQLTLAYDRMSEAEREAAKGKELLKHIQDLQNQIRPLEESTGRFQRSVGNYQQSIVNAVASMNPLAAKLSGFVDFSDEAAGGFTKLKTSAQAFGKTLLSLVKNPAFLAIAGIASVGSAFKLWYDYNKGLIEATRLTKQFTDLSGNELKAYRNEVQAVSDTFNKDFVEVLRGANALQKQFGITSQEAIELVKEGFINGADVNGEFLKNVKEYSTFFKEAGLSAEEFVAINAQTEKMGIFSDKGIDAIKEANIRLREMTTATSTALEGIGISSERVQEELQNGSKTTFDIIREVSAKLNELPDSASTVGAALADIFGDPGEDAGLAYIRTLSNISTSLSDVKSKTGELGNLQREQLQSQINLENAISALFDQTGGGFEKMTTQAKIFINNGLSGIIRGVIDLINWFIELYNNSVAIRVVWEGFVGQFKIIIAQIGNLFSLFIDQAKAVGKVLEGTFTLDFSKMKEGYSDFAKSYSTLAKSVVSDYKDIFVKGINDIKNGKIEPIKIPIEADTESLGGGTGNSGSEGGTNNGDNTPKRDIKAEAEEIEKAEAAMLKVLDEASAEYKAILDKRYKRDKKAIEDKIALYEEDKKLTPKMQKALNDQLEALEKEHARDIAAISKKATDDQIAEQERLINLKLEAAEKGSEKEHTLRLQQLEQQKQQEIAAAKGNEEEIALIKEKYRIKESEEDKRFKDNQAKQQADVYKKELNERNLEWQNKIDAAKMNGENYLQLMVEQSQQELEAIKEAGQKECETKEEYNARLLAAQQKYNDSVKAKNDAEVQMQYAKAQAIGSIMGSLSSMIGAFGEENLAALKLSKALAIAEVAINQGIAISKIVKSAADTPGGIFKVIASIVSGVALVTAQIIQAKQAINSAEAAIAEAESQKSSGRTGTVTVKGYSTGGLVKGEGTGTSDSIPARLSAGEFVIPAKTYKMFSPVINSIYRTGQNWNAANRVYSPASSNYGNTISEEMLVEAFVKGAQKINIKPTVSVVDINKQQTNVDVIQSRNRRFSKK